MYPSRFILIRDKCLLIGYCVEGGVQVRSAAKAAAKLAAPVVAPVAARRLLAEFDN